MVWVIHWTGLIFGDLTLVTLTQLSSFICSTFLGFVLKFLPSLSQCTSGNLKLVPLGGEAFCNFHFDFAVDPVDLRALFECWVCYPFKLFFFYLMLSQDCSHKEREQWHTPSPSILRLHSFSFLICWYFYDKEYKLCVMWLPLHFLMKLGLKS